MAKNQYGFLSKRYPQPKKYDLIFCSWNAVYNGNDGKEYMIEAVPYFLAANKQGAEVMKYQVIRRDKDCRRVVGSSKTQKGAVEILAKYCIFY